jgi:carbon storage regulator CsrA
MLVLSRKVNEEIIIGENIRVFVVRIAGNRVRLGITAPDDVKITRAEVCFDADEKYESPEMAFVN